MTVTLPIHSAEFLLSAPKLSVVPPPSLPEIAFVGRSNVGKSSLMNMLLGRRKLVKTSSTPGKTQALNFFTVNEAFYFVDMPGYGYAKVPEKLRKSWGGLAEGYLLERPTLRLVVQLIDGRHLPTRDDIQMLDWLLVNEVATILVMTKIDKLPKTKREKHRKQILAKLELGPENLIPCSSVERTGYEAIWDVIDAALSER